MHVLVLPSWYGTPEEPWRGIFFENQAVALARSGARVGMAFLETRSLRLLSPSKVRESHFQIAAEEDRGVTFLRMKGWNTVGQTVIGARVWAALSERLVRAYVHRFGMPDVIHAHAALWAGRVAVRMGQAFARPSVVTEHSSAILLNDLNAYERREAARVYRAAHAVLSVSRAMSVAVDSIAEIGLARVVPNAVDFEFFTRPSVPRRRQPFTFLSVSNLVGGKQIDKLIRAFASASSTLPGIRLVIVGTGAEAESLQRLAGQCGVAAQVEFAGGLRPEGVRECLWRANALVLPSDFETFGVVLVEALATGIPVIATRCGGPEDIVEPESGLLVNRNDVNALASALVAMTGRVYSETVLRDHARARFSFETVAHELLRVYASTGSATRGLAASGAHQR